MKLPAITGIRNAVTSKVGRQMLTMQKHSPALLFGAGVVGVVAAAVLASRATLKLDDELDHHAETLEKIQHLEEIDPEYRENTASRDKMVLIARTSGRIARLYALPVSIGVLSICALTGSHIILTRRNLALTAAYATIDRSFREYRQRVVAEYGNDKDDEFRFGTVEHQVEKSDGKVKTVKNADPNGLSMYARFFDEESPNWKTNAEYNLLFLRNQQNWANDKLKAQGHLFLNEVYDMLGLRHTGAGAVVGWIIGAGNDNYVDFGIYSRDGDPKVRQFVNGGENVIRLDFNVDGVIYDKI